MKQSEKVKLKKIRVGSSCQSNEITYRRRYRVKIDGEWYEGFFSKQWFGWQFDNYGSSGKQLNLIDEVYEIVHEKPKKKGAIVVKEPEISLPEEDTHES